MESDKPFANMTGEEIMAALSQRKKDDTTKTIFSAIGALVSIPLVIVFMMIVPIFWEGYAIAKLWAWFIVPTFGLAPLHMVAAVGLALLMGLLATQYVPYDQKTQKHPILAALMYAYGKPALALLIGWIVLHYADIFNRII